MIFQLATVQAQEHDPFLLEREKNEFLELFPSRVKELKRNGEEEKSGN